MADRAAVVRTWHAAYDLALSQNRDIGAVRQEGPDIRSAELAGSGASPVDDFSSAHSDP